MKKLAVLSLLFFLIGCNGYSTSETGISGDVTSEMKPEESLTVNSSSEEAWKKEKPVRENQAVRNSPKKIIKEGSMAIEVQELKPSKEKVDKLVKSLNGYYDNEVYQNQYNSRVYNLKIRVPVDCFENLVNSLEDGFDKIIDKSISTVDVTARYIDLDSRLTSKRAALERYRAILKNAKNIKEILEVEEYIRKIEEEIESAVVQLKQLSSQASYSTLSVRLQQPVVIEIADEKPGFWTEAGHAIVGGWSGLKSFLLVVLRVWPLLVIIVLSIVGIRWFRGR